MPEETDYTEELDRNALKNKIKAVLRRYFDTDDSGEPTPEFDEYLTAQEAIDEIHEIVGDI